MRWKIGQKIKYEDINSNTKITGVIKSILYHNKENLEDYTLTIKWDYNDRFVTYHCTDSLLKKIRSEFSLPEDNPNRKFMEGKENV